MGARWYSILDICIQPAFPPVAARVPLARLLGQGPQIPVQWPIASPIVPLPRLPTETMPSSIRKGTSPCSLHRALERARSMMHEIYLVVIAWTLWKVLTSFGPTHALTHPRNSSRNRRAGCNPGQRVRLLAHSYRLPMHQHDASTLHHGPWLCNSRRNNLHRDYR